MAARAVDRARVPDPGLRHDLPAEGPVRRDPQATPTRRYSEGRAAHWLLLIAADRVDAWESHLRSFATLRPDNPITETGVLSEFSRHGISSRFGRKRADVGHQLLDPIIVAGPWIAAGAAAYAGIRSVRRARRG